MNVIYEPKGRAREYSPLACNLYRGCTHGCKYCYAPACMRTTNAKWCAEATPRTNVLTLLEKDAHKLRGDKRDILFCFLSDPYQPLERTAHLTRQALEIVGYHKLQSQVLTKGCGDLIAEDFPLMKKIGTKLGITLSFCDDASRLEWEPEASSVADRLRLLKEAHAQGIFTWVSMEPVIDPEQALQVIRMAHAHVDFWKIGKLNHNKTVEAGVDWRKFLGDATALLSRYDARYLIKEDLARFASP